MMRALNTVTGWLVDTLLWPLERWPPVAGLTLVSLIVAAALLAAIKATSNQRAIVQARRRIEAGLMELRLFQDDPYLVVRAVGELFGQQVVYLRYALVPLLWVSLPLSLLMAHLQAHYGYEGLRPGATTTVVVRLAADASGPGRQTYPPLAIDAPAGLRVETSSVWVPALREAAWRIRADREGDFDLRVTWRHTTVTKRVRVSPLVVTLATVRPSQGVWQQWLHPAEPPLPSDVPIEAIEVAYSPRGIHVLGASVSWIVVFLVLATAFTLLGRPLFNVAL